MPLLYRQDPLGILNGVKRIISFFIGLTRPFFRSGGSAQQRIMVHKSCALAAQTFMLSIAAEGFHSCPMEGFDEIRVKRALRITPGSGDQHDHFCGERHGGRHLGTAIPGAE
jgi:nitroreductase